MPSQEKFSGGLTVLMAVYAGDNPYLFRRAVESVYQNTLRPDHMILVVDGPVPEEVECVIRHAVAAEGVNVVRLVRNQGLAKALNEGLKFVQTEWVARADADDINLPDRFLQQCRTVCMNPDVDLVGGAIEEVEEDGCPVAIRRVPLDPLAIKKRLRRRNPFNHVTVLARTHALIDAGGYPDLHLKEDYGLWARIIAAGGECMNTDAILVRVTAGRKMYGRRGGLRYIQSEVLLQKELVRLKISSGPSALLNGLARTAVFLLPAVLKGQFYLRFLRSAPQAAEAA